MLQSKAWSRCLLGLLIINGLAVGRVLWQESHQSTVDTLTRHLDQRLALLHDHGDERVIGFPILNSFDRREREALLARAQYNLAPRLIIDDATANVLLIDPAYTDRPQDLPVTDRPMLYRRSTGP